MSRSRLQAFGDAQPPFLAWKSSGVYTAACRPDIRGAFKFVEVRWWARWRHVFVCDGHCGVVCNRTGTSRVFDGQTRACCATGPRRVPSPVLAVVSVSTRECEQGGSGPATTLLLLPRGSEGGVSGS